MAGGVRWGLKRNMKNRQTDRRADERMNAKAQLSPSLKRRPNKQAPLAGMFLRRDVVFISLSSLLSSHLMGSEEGGEKKTIASCT